VRKRLYLIAALVLALSFTSGAYAYTYPTASSTIAVAEPTGDIATVTETEANDQPNWDSLLPQEESTSETLRPDGTGDLTQIASQEPDSGAHWDKVDEETADGDITYVFTTSNEWENDLYTPPPHSEGSGTVLSVTVFMVSKASASPIQDSARILISTHGQAYYGTEELMTTDYASYSHEWDINPYTDEAWTWDEIDALQIGVGIRKAGPVRATICTQVYVVIDYKFAVIEGNIPTGDLFIVTPHSEYTGDLEVKVYLINTGALIKAYRYLNIKLDLEDAVEEFQILSLNNGMATFNMENYTGDNYTLSVSGGSYNLVSLDTSQWSEGWSITPELYSEVTQR